jgi:hypothetical protein
VQPLIDTLSDPRKHIQEQAGAAIAKLAHDNDLTRDTITKLGGVKPLIGLLERHDDGSADDGAEQRVRQNAAGALANLAIEPAARDEIVSEGGVPPLVHLLEADGRAAKQSAATALARLSKEHELTQSAIAAAGAIAPLVALLDGNEGPEAQEEAAGAILALADHEGNR